MTKANSGQSPSGLTPGMVQAGVEVAERLFDVMGVTVPGVPFFRTSLEALVRRFLTDVLEGTTS